MTRPPKFYGRRIAKGLGAPRRQAYHQLMALYAAPRPAPGACLDYATIFPDYQPERRLHFDIGFGSGDSLLYWAAREPDAYILGCEAFINGLVSVAQKIHLQALTRVRLLADDVRLWLPYLPPASIDSISAFFPDPWPKARHHKRRLYQLPVLQQVRALLRPDGALYFASDSADYAQQVIEVLPAAGFTIVSQHLGAQPPFLAGLATRYQQKALQAGRLPLYLHAQRV